MRNKGMRTDAILTLSGLAVLAFGGGMAILGWHRTVGLGGVALGIVLIFASLVLRLRSPKNRVIRETSGPAQPARSPSLRNAVLAIMVVAVIGFATFYGTLYLSPKQQGPGGSNRKSSSFGTTTSNAGQLTSTTETFGTIPSCQSRGAVGGSSPSTVQLVIDGSAIEYSDTGTIASVHLTTSNSPDLIVVFLSVLNDPTGSGTSPPRIKSFSSGVANLTFHQRAYAVTITKNAGSNIFSEEEWYAVAGRPLNAESIVAELSSGSPHVSMIAFGISGANTSSPFDPNSSLPAIGTGSSTGIIGFPICTDNPNDIIIGGAAMSSVLPAAGSGFTLIQSDEGKSGGADPVAEYELVTSRSTNHQVSFSGEGQGLSAIQTWVVIADAIRAAK